MKKTILFFIFTVFYSLAVFSQNQTIFNDMLSSNYRAPGGNYDKVKLFISVEEGESIMNAMEDVKSAMKVRDPNGIFNPYWIVKIPDESFWKNEAVIIGTWYTDGYSGWSNWTSKLESRLNDIPNLTFYKVTPLGQ